MPDEEEFPPLNQLSDRELVTYARVIEEQYHRVRVELLNRMIRWKKGQDHPYASQQTGETSNPP